MLVLLANGMASQGWQVTFVAPDYASASPFPLDPRIRVTVVSTGPRWLPQLLRKALYYTKLFSSATNGAHLCLANYYLTAYCAVISRMLRGRESSILWYIQGYEAGSHGLLAEDGPVGRLIRYALACLSYRLPVPVYCVSEWVKDRIGRPDARVVHPPAVNLEQFSPEKRVKNEGRTVIGTIGRQGDTKGYCDFLSAVEELPETNGIQVLVASPKANEVPLPTRVASEGIHAGTEAAMADFYRRCDIFVLSSRMEGFPLPPLEAMASGCAVVTTACGGVVEYTQDGVNGLVVPSRAPTAMAKAIKRLCQDQGLRERLAEAGIKTAQRYRQQDLVDRFVESIAERMIPIRHRERVARASESL